jgi:LysM repeat protein
MYGKFVVLILLVVSVSACSLGAYEERIEPLSAAQPTSTMVSTPIPTLSATSTVFLASPTPDIAADQGILSADTVANTPVSADTESACTLKNEWPVYTVMAGDTLAAIARRTDSSTAELVEANCLTDPNLLRVGQTVYVPQMSDSETPLMAESETISEGRYEGTLDIFPVLYTEGDTLVLQAGDTVDLHWYGANLD